MRTLNSLSLLGASVVLTSALAGLSGCTVEARPEAHYARPAPVYEATPVYQQPTYQQPVYREAPPVYQQAPVYQAPPPPPPQVIVERERDHGFDRRPILDALARLRQADQEVVPDHLNPSKESLRSAREILKHSGRDARVDDALNRIEAALDAAEHSRPRIEQDHIREAITILHNGWEGDRR